MTITLSYTEKGSGDTLILLHGNGESSDYFWAQIEYFSKFYRVIALDTRGHGKSPRGDAPFTLAQFADDLCCFMKSMNIEDANILGFSDGGNIAMLFALAHPDMVKKLILNGANMYPAGLCIMLRLANRAGLMLFSLAGLFSKASAHRAALIRLMTAEPHIEPWQLSELDIPTLVIAGSHDLIKRSHTELIARSLPRAELCILKGGHSIAATSPVEFNKAVQKFLQNQHL